MIRTASLLCLLSAALPLAAQTPTTRAEAFERQRETTYRSPLSPDTDPVERAVIWAKEHKLLDVFQGSLYGFEPTIGGMINGSGFATGIQYSRRDLLDGNLAIRSSARISTQGYQLFDFEVGMPHIANDRAFGDIYVRHRNYSQVPYYGPGPNSRREGRSNYRLEDTSADFTAGVLPARWLRMAATGGYLAVNVGPGTAERYIGAEKIYSPQQAPGIDRQTDFLRGGGIVQVDYRDSPYGPRAGGQYYARFDYYKDQTLGQFSFRQLTAEAQQFVPLFNKKRVFAARIRTTLSYPNAGQRVPFYLQPSVGSADELRGFRAFRFYDNNSLSMTGEWRWEVFSGVDAALFVDGGKVFPRPGLLNFRDLEGSYGGGFRIRSPGTGAVIARLDIGASREGFQIWLVFNDVFAAPRIRTGRELSPPPGRLP